MNGVTKNGHVLVRYMNRPTRRGTEDHSPKDPQLVQVDD